MSSGRAMPQRPCQALQYRAAPGHHNLAVRSSSCPCNLMSRSPLLMLRMATASVATALLSMHLLRRELMCSATLAALMWIIPVLALHASASLLTAFCSLCSAVYLLVGFLAHKAAGTLSYVMHISRSLRRRQPWLGNCCGRHPRSAAAGSHCSCAVPGQAQAA